jgi:hypothetical protein
MVDGPEKQTLLVPVFPPVLHLLNQLPAARVTRASRVYLVSVSLRINKALAETEPSYLCCTK